MYTARGCAQRAAPVSNRSCSVRAFVLALAGIRRIVVQTKAIKKGDVMGVGKGRVGNGIGNRAGDERRKQAAVPLSALFQILLRHETPASNRPFQLLGSVLARAGIRRRVVQIEAVGEDDLIPL